MIVYNTGMLDKIVKKLINRHMLTRLLMLWMVTTIVASALSVLFVSNTASIATTSVNPLQQEELISKTDKTINSDLLQMVTVPERLIIESLDIDLHVSNPDTTSIEELDAELQKNIVRYPLSGMLGESDKNIIIFGHSARIPTFNGMYRAFNDIEYLNEGEIITLIGNGRKYTYRVSDVYKSSAETGEIVLATNNNMLTLVTCDGFGQKSDRWIVEADFIGSF